jgi:hypothetical protein
MRLIDTTPFDIKLMDIPDGTEDYKQGYIDGARHVLEEMDEAPTVDAVQLDKLCELLAEMYHCPASGRPSSNHACHPDCPDEAFEKLCGTDCDNHIDAERWKAFLEHWMEELHE